MTRVSPRRDETRQVRAIHKPVTRPIEGRVTGMQRHFTTLRGALRTSGGVGEGQFGDSQPIAAAIGGSHRITEHL